MASENETDYEDCNEEESSRVSKNIKNSLNYKPIFNKSRNATSNKLRTKLKSFKSTPSTSTETPRATRVKNTDDDNLRSSLGVMRNDMVSLLTRFDCIIDCINTIFDRLDALEKSVDLINMSETRKTFANTAKNPANNMPNISNDDSTARLERLEYIQSEEERKK